MAAHGHLGQQHGLVDLAKGVDAHVGKQHRVADHRARNDAAARDHGVDGEAVFAVGVLHKLGRGQLALAGPDGPFGVVDVELGRDRGEVEVGFPEGVDGAHVAPVRLGIGGGRHARHGKRVGHGAALTHHAGDHVFAEVVAGGGVGQVFFKQAVKVGRVEDVDAHAGERHRVAAGHGGRVLGFFHKVGDAAFGVHRHHAKRRGFFARHFNAAHGAARARSHMVLQHERVVHFVDMVAGQHHHVFGVAGLDDVHVLVNRVGRAAVPVFFVHPLLGGQQVHHFIEFGAQKAPAALQVAQQRVRLVLRDHADAANARVHAVGQREIDDAEFATEIHRRLGALVGELLQARAATAREHQGDGSAHQHVGLHVAVGVQGRGLAAGAHGLGLLRCGGGVCLRLGCVQGQVITVGVCMPVWWVMRASAWASAISGAKACWAGRSWRLASGSWRSR